VVAEFKDEHRSAFRRIEHEEFKALPEQPQTARST
jgi:hypothetical protein